MDPDDPILLKLATLKQNLQRCVYSNSRADELERLEDDAFVLDRERQQYCHNANEEKIKRIVSTAQSLIQKLRETR